MSEKEIQLLGYYCMSLSVLLLLIWGRLLHDQVTFGYRRRIHSYREFCQKTNFELAGCEMHFMYIAWYLPSRRIPVGPSKLWGDFKEVIQWARDKYWFYYVIDGDEFHPSLNLNMKKIMCASHYGKAIRAEQVRVSEVRARAHKLDVIYNGYNRGMVL